jgi:hypothetical protein
LPITILKFSGGSLLLLPSFIRTIPPYAETNVSVGLARPFWTLFSILYAIEAIFDRPKSSLNSSFIADSVATTTAAEEPRPDELGSWE